MIISVAGRKRASYAGQPMLSEPALGQDSKVPSNVLGFGVIGLGRKSQPLAAMLDGSAEHGS